MRSPHVPIRALYILLLVGCASGVLAQENSRDNAPLIWIPAGVFTMGSQTGRSEERPSRQIYLDDYWIYKYEVTVNQYQRFCDATKRRMPPGQNGKLGSMPVTNVTWNEAMQYAQWAGGSLPTEAQWEKAARGTNGQDYPWGMDWDENRCAIRKGCCPVGQYAQGNSPYGVCDMAGNAWEWCSDWYDPSYYGRMNSPTRNPMGPGRSLPGFGKVIRGGSYLYTTKDNYRCAKRDHFGGTYLRTYREDTGFRCVIYGFSDASNTNGTAQQPYGRSSRYSYRPRFYQPNENIVVYPIPPGSDAAVLIESTEPGASVWSGSHYLGVTPLQLVMVTGTRTREPGIVYLVSPSIKKSFRLQIPEAFQEQSSANAVVDLKLTKAGFMTNHGLLNVTKGTYRRFIIPMVSDESIVHVPVTQEAASAVGITADGGAVLAIDKTIVRKVNQYEERVAGHGGDILAMAASPNGKWLVSSEHARNFCVWDIQRKNLLTSILNLPAVTSAFAFSADSSLLAAGFENGDAAIFTKYTSTRPTRISLETADEGSPGEAVWALAFSSDGAELALAHGRVITIASTDDGSILNTLYGSRCEIEALAYLPNSHNLVSGGNEAKLTVWDTTTGRISHEITLQKTGISSLATTSDGSYLIAGCYDGYIRAWETRMWRESYRQYAHYGGVSAIALSKDGMRLASSGNDYHARLWELPLATR